MLTTSPPGAVTQTLETSENSNRTRDNTSSDMVGRRDPCRRNVIESLELGEGHRLQEA